MHLLFRSDSQPSFLCVIFEKLSVAAPIYCCCELPFSLFIGIVFIENIEKEISEDGLALAKRLVDRGNQRRKLKDLPTEKLFSDGGPAGEASGLYS